MGIGGISIWQLLIILLIVVLIFGTKRLKGMGSDLGGAMKGFKDAMNEDGKTEAQDQQKSIDDPESKEAASGQATNTSDDKVSQDR